MPVKFIAEVSSNHNRDLNRCFEFIDKAAEIGCAVVKFQLFKIRDMFAPEILAKSQMHRDREQWELPTDFLPELASKCEHAGVEFACTPFYLEAVDQLYEYVSMYKIASYELLWDDLLTACAKTGKPVVLSTGMATLAEIRNAVDVLRNSGCKKLTVLHCVSSYPSPPEQCNLSAIKFLREELNCDVGWSDHSTSPAVICRAVLRWKASTVEFHLDLDGQGEEYKSGHCWLPSEIQSVINLIQRGFQTDGSGDKYPVASELPDRDWRADPSDGLRPLLSKRLEWK